MYWAEPCIVLYPDSNYKEKVRRANNFSVLNELNCKQCSMTLACISWRFLNYHENTQGKNNFTWNQVFHTNLAATQENTEEQWERSRGHSVAIPCANPGSLSDLWFPQIIGVKVWTKLSQTFCWSSRKFPRYSEFGHLVVKMKRLSKKLGFSGNYSPQVSVLTRLSSIIN